MILLEQQARTVRRLAEDRYWKDMGQLSSYFDLLIRLAYRTGDRQQLSPLFDRIENVLAEMERRRPQRIRKTVPEPSGAVNRGGWTR